MKWCVFRSLPELLIHDPNNKYISSFVPAFTLKIQQIQKSPDLPYQGKN